jgi:hypothetical protein
LTGKKWLLATGEIQITKKFARREQWREMIRLEFNKEGIV